MLAAPASGVSSGGGRGRAANTGYHTDAGVGGTRVPRVRPVPARRAGGRSGTGRWDGMGWDDVQMMGRQGPTCSAGRVEARVD